MSLPPEYFAQMYAAHDDPWQFRTRWYEQRKRALTLAALPRSTYDRVFEPGCSIGLLTTALAPRCRELVASDVSDAAVTACRAATAGFPHVTVARVQVPHDWPDGRFDLVVLSELGYYLDAADLLVLVARAASSLSIGGTLLACHWRHGVADHLLSGDAVHEAVHAHPDLVAASRHVEEDFRLDVLTRGAVLSPARREGLLNGEQVAPPDHQP
jgi:trans-aconitate methyltransferase